jgi:hypothetical protein
MLRNIREAIQEGTPEWIAGQNELVAGLQSHGADVQEPPATEDNIHFKKERKEEEEEEGRTSECRRVSGN